MTAESCQSSNGSWGQQNSRREWYEHSPGRSPGNRCGMKRQVPEGRPKRHARYVGPLAPSLTGLGPVFDHASQDGVLGKGTVRIPQVPKGRPKKQRSGSCRPYGTRAGFSTTLPRTSSWATFVLSPSGMHGPSGPDSCVLSTLTEPLTLCPPCPLWLSGFRTTGDTGAQACAQELLATIASRDTTTPAARGAPASNLAN